MIIPAEAAPQGGCFLFPQAKAVGWTYDLLASAVQRERLHRVRRGVWIERALWDLMDERAQHLALVRADLLCSAPGWHAARRSAAIAMGLPLIGALPTQSQLVSDKPAGAFSRHRKVSPLPAGHVAVRDGIQITTLSRTAVDEARYESFLSAVVVMDAVLGLGVPHTSLEAVLATMPGWVGVPAAHDVLAFADGLSESAFESLSRVRLHERGLPAPELQVEIWLGDKFLGRADKCWRERKVVGEDDGMAKFGDSNAEREASFRKLYQRGADLEDAGLVVARWDWDTAWRDKGKALEERVLKAFARAEGRELDPRLRFVPTTVADRLRRQGRRAS